MATRTIIIDNSSALPTVQQDVLRAVFCELKEQLNRGEAEPISSFASVSVLGTKGIRQLKSKLEGAFGQSMDVELDLLANTVKVLPVLNMSGVTDTVDAVLTNEPLKKIKVPRPPNAFILYRKEWHPRIVAANPELHNNRISILLGEKWRSEPQVVRDEYKRRAMLAKEEHAVLHPNYSYQPRRPSEKKRRMTKSKLARTAALTAPRLPQINLDQIQHHAVLNAADDFDGQLGVMLEEAKTGHQGAMPDYAASCIINTSDDYITDDTAHLPFATIQPDPTTQAKAWQDVLAILANQQQTLFYSNDSTLPGPGYRGGMAHPISKIDEHTEIQRQVSLQEEMNALFDFDGATATAQDSFGDEWLSPGSDASSVIATV